MWKGKKQQKRVKVTRNEVLDVKKVIKMGQNDNFNVKVGHFVIFGMIYFQLANKKLIEWINS